MIKLNRSSIKGSSERNDDEGSTNAPSSSLMAQLNGNRTLGYYAGGLVRRARRSSILNPRYNKLSTQLTTDPLYNEYNVMYQRTRSSVIRLSTAAALGLIGDLFFPPLSWVAIGIILYGFYTIPKRGFIVLIKHRRFTVDLISTFSVLAGLFSGYVTLSAVIALIAFSAVRVMNRVKGETQAQVVNVFKHQPMFVWVLEGDQEIEIPFRALQTEDVVIVTAGNTIPVDGIIADGFAAIDQQALTGEAQPVEKGIGEEVLASTVVISGKLYITVVRAGEDTKVAQIGTILNQSIRRKSETQLRAERFADRTVLPTVVAASLLLPFAGLAGSFAFLTGHFRRLPALMVALAAMNYIRILTDNRILVKDGRALDSLPEVDTLVFDKTGTLTITQPHLEAVHPCADYSAAEILRLAAAAEHRQMHPIALAILEAAAQQQLDIPPVDDIHYELGFGLNVTINSQRIRVGSRRFMERESIAVPEDIDALQDSAQREGSTIVMVAVDDTLIGAIELVPTVRPEARAIIEELRLFGIKETYIISGDHEQPTRKLAHDLGIDHYYAETLPEQKASIIEDLIAQGRTVCYIGDGINDAIALQTAQVSISLSGASTVATDSAQVILMDEHLERLPTFFTYGYQYGQLSRSLLYGMVGLGVVGMTGALLPFGVAFAFTVNISNLLGGMAVAMTPLLRYEWEKARAAQPGEPLPSGETLTTEPQLNAAPPLLITPPTSNDTGDTAHHPTA
ncbi:MAG: heavy metal translocating P-type ATPase [Chloroflexi bacterium]|nr:heavy metal translocating P-type ATPase [Chloroflexota bacterium]